MDPGETSYTAEIFVIALCLMLSALFSAAETAITSLGSLKARHILDNEGRSVRPLTLWLSHPGRVLTTILIFNNLVNILASAIITNLTAQLAQSRALGIATGISTLLVLIFGEIIPKSFGRTHADKVAIPALNGIYAVYTCTAPLVWVFSELANRLVTLIGGVKKEAPPITEEELEFLVNVGERAGVLEETKKDMLVGVFEFDETKVREIMTPRPDIRWITMDATLNEVLSSVVESGMSRIPVCSVDGIDHIVGILLVKDLLRIVRDQKPEKPAFQIRDVMREPFFIPESKPIMEVFKELKSTKNHIAIVIDEHGGTAGLVTMEDILEEIVGDIQDEYDTEEAEIIEIGAGSYDVAGSCNIDEFLDYFELDETLLKDRPEDGIDTISGWLTSRLGELHRIKRVHVSRVPPVEAQA